MKVNKKLLQNELTSKHEKILTLKDIHNLALNNPSTSNAIKTLGDNFKMRESLKIVQTS